MATAPALSVGELQILRRVDRALSARFLPPGAAVPAPVAEAARVVDDRRAVLQEAASELRDAKYKLRRAPALDREAERAARAAGEAMPSEAKRHDPAARHEFLMVERRVNAARAALDDAVVVLARLVVEHRAGWRADQEVLIDELRASARGKLGELVEALDRLAVERGIAAGLEAFPAQGSLVGQHFGRDTAESRAARRARAAEELARTSAEGNMKDRVRLEVDSLVAALARKVG